MKGRLVSQKSLLRGKFAKLQARKQMALRKRLSTKPVKRVI
jgi:hypothetical protein